MKIIVLNFEDCSVELSSRGKVCRAYGEKANGEDVPLYEYDEKKRVIFAHSEIGPVGVEADIGPKKAKQWFLEATLRHLEEKNGPVWVFFDRQSAMWQIASEINAALSAESLDVAKLKAMNEMYMAILKMDDPN
jgi:hypothetical protein